MMLPEDQPSTLPFRARAEITDADRYAQFREQMIEDCVHEVRLSIATHAPSEVVIFPHGAITVHARTAAEEKGITSKDVIKALKQDVIGALTALGIQTINTPQPRVGVKKTRQSEYSDNQFPYESVDAEEMTPALIAEAMHVFLGLLSDPYALGLEVNSFALFRKISDVMDPLAASLKRDDQYYAKKRALNVVQHAVKECALAYCRSRNTAIIQEGNPLKYDDTSPESLLTRFPELRAAFEREVSAFFSQADGQEMSFHAA